MLRRKLLHSPDYFKSILKQFPDVDFAVAYGSGVYGQRSYDVSANKPTIDMIFAVSNPSDWHEKNLAIHSRHYSEPLRSLGYVNVSLSFVRKTSTNVAFVRGRSSAIAWVQNSGGANVYYHPFVDLDDRQQLKYGVISTDDLCLDLERWNTLFCAGRLHKPALIVKTTPELKKKQRDNLTSAVASSLLLLPKTFSLNDLFVKITSLSYAGDPRFDFGAENADKVSNIVAANLDGFSELYAPYLNNCVVVFGPDLSDQAKADIERDGVMFERDMSVKAVEHLCAQLPSEIREALRKHGSIESLHANGTLDTSLRSVLATTIRRVAVGQYAKGVVTAGLGKSVQYLKEKFSKGLLRRRR